MPKNLAERHDAAGQQVDALIAAANGDRQPPPIDGGLTPVWSDEHSKWYCIIHGKTAWWMSEMWRDPNNYPFWCIIIYNFHYCYIEIKENRHEKLHTHTHTRI